MAGMEMRVLFGGPESTVGYAYDEVAGTTVKEKRAWILAAAPADIMKHVKDGTGFCLTHDQTTAALLPSGFIYTVMSSTGCTGLRWSVSADQSDNRRVRRMCEVLQTSYKEMAAPSTGYPQWVRFLEAEEG